MKSSSKKVFGRATVVVGLALCGIGAWLLIRPMEYQAKVRIQLEPNINTSGSEESYDPYFIQTEFELIQSEAVLGNVIEALNLNVEWGKNTREAGHLKLTKRSGC